MERPATLAPPELERRLFVKPSVAGDRENEWEGFARSILQQCNRLDGSPARDTHSSRGSPYQSCSATNPKSQASRAQRFCRPDLARGTQFAQVVRRLYDGADRLIRRLGQARQVDTSFDGPPRKRIFPPSRGIRFAVIFAWLSADHLIPTLMRAGRTGKKSKAIECGDGRETCRASRGGGAASHRDDADGVPVRWAIAGRDRGVPQADPVKI